MRLACLLVLTAGCGATPPADGRPADGGIADGSAADAGHDPVIGTVRVTAAVADTVESFDAADKLVATAATDASGTASVAITRGGSISVLRTDASQGATYVWTFVDVEDGDDLVVEGRYVPGNSDRGSMIVSLPPVTNALRYKVGLPRVVDWNYAPNFSLAIPASSSPTFPLFVEADGSDGAQLGFWAQEATFRDGATLDFGPPTPFNELNVTLLHVPANARMWSARVDSWFHHSRIYGSERTVSWRDTPPPDLGLAYPPGLDDRHTLEVLLTKTAFVANATIAISAAIDSPPTGLTFDVAAHLAPWLESIAAPAGELTWVETGSQPYDGARFRTSYYRWSVDRASLVAVWTVIAQRGSHPRFPRPGLLSPGLLVAYDGELVEDSQFEGYRDFRNDRRHLEVPAIQTTSARSFSPL